MGGVGPRAVPARESRQTGLPNLHMECPSWGESPRGRCLRERPAGVSSRIPTWKGSRLAHGLICVARSEVRGMRPCALTLLMLLSNAVSAEERATDAYLYQTRDRWTTLAKKIW